MKTILATVVLAVLAIAPAAASDAGYGLRGVEKAASTQVDTKTGTASTPVADAAQAKKVRVVLASPYGN
ncbi:hypothetical protein Q8W71_30650 [Methylobacterium sp. NEAU 140]|uniref:hypothetical protein n=1 Tax=Methylobacterium sp. NEAU 140 TaxID=3064945 RepID=UPI00273774B5|nr:hypothetical protein [Methylobacterium sp. NEAU 140]MDP4026952.1 hypothetical protein [Methylobacterium sp. NEAU 140]